MYQMLKGRPVWWHHHVGVFFTSLLFLIQICVVRGIELHALSENLFDQYLIESDAGRSKKTSCISFLDSVSCENLKGVGSLNNTCLLNSNLHLDDDLCLYGTGNLVVCQHVSITCPIKGCSVTINVSGSVQVGPYAQVVAGSIVFGATNFTLYHHSTIDTTSLGGPPPAQTSGTPTGNDGAGGGHGGRGASCLKSNRTNWGGDVYAWSTLSDPWSYGSKGGSRSAEKQYGGDGGGRIMVKVNDSLIVDGTISAEGGSGSLEGGGGSGGSIIIHALKLKYCVKCINSRVQLIRKKRQATVRWLKTDVADLLADGHELNAFGRIEALIVEINRTSCYDMIEQYCQCILNRLSSIQKQRECPEEAMEAVSTLIFAAARFSDLPELYKLRQVFTERYGSHMESSVNAEFVEKVQKKSFSTDKKLRLMQDIAEEFSVRWDSRAFRQKLSNPSAPPSDQPKRSINNIEGRSHAEISGRNAAVIPQKEATFDTAVEVNGRNRATLNEASSANRSNGAVFNAYVAVNGKKEAVSSPVAAVNSRARAGLNAGGLVNGRKEAVINSVAAVNGRDGAVLNAGGSFNGDITVNGRKETVTNSAMPFNRRNDAVSGAGEGREAASKERREPPSWTFVQKQLVQPQPRDIHVIPVIRSGRSHSPEKIKKVPAVAKETVNVEPVYDNAGVRPYVKPKEWQNGIQKDDWFKPKVSQNGIHKHDGLNESTACSRSPIAQDGPGLIGLEKQSVAPAISRDVKAVNMIPPSTKLKESRNDAVERVAVYNESPRAEEVSDPTVQERRPTVLVNSKDARPFNMIPPPYTKPRFRNTSTPADDTKHSDVPIKSSCTADHERSDDGDKAKPVSVRRRLPKPTIVTESDNVTNNAKSNGRQADDDLYAEKNLDGNQRKTAAEELNGAVNVERHAHGRRKYGGRRSTATYDGDLDEEEAAMDRLLLHFSKRGMNNDPSRRRARPRSPELLVDAGRVRDHLDDLPHSHHHGNGRTRPSTTESVCYRPERVASLLSEPTTPVVKGGASKGPARATSMQPDLLSSGGAR